MLAALGRRAAAPRRRPPGLCPTADYSPLTARHAVAIDTMKVQHLRDHISSRPKDQDARRTLQRVLNHRRTMLKYLKRTDLEGYLRVVKTLGLQDNVQAAPKLHHKKLTRKRA